MSEAPKREWRFYIQDMIDFGEKVVAYTQGMTLETFVANDLHFDATIRRLELMGEAATRIPAEIRDSHPEISWRMIIAARNRLIHGYLGIDNDTLWSMVRDDVPALLPKLRAILDTGDGRA
ncbi:DUF86 domain-containing protein [Pseudothauera nasutitermitis]|uniref:DUF86 domain-containing protein n=1 Tax=Pseudothauera nasutitermitis TaxID=2565930 RepID=A0A4S4AQQ1_9RHOO|nr:DUF86 domain-containing protein [Pseudothauera nasutitermitis]THF60775.1 DUF86 domain-containing protein [Pseudothauera nasutitermitis]